MNNFVDWYLPREVGFDALFMMDVLRGKKKYLPLSVSSGYELPYFRTGDTLTKNYIISKMVNNVAYKDYIPNNVNISRLSRKFLLSVRYLFIIFI